MNEEELKKDQLPQILHVKDLQVLDISLDGIVFHDRAPQTVAKCVLDYFAGKSEEESQRYIDLCMSADKLK